MYIIVFINTAASDLSLYRFSYNSVRLTCVQ